jgi:hypothetical protein
VLPGAVNVIADVPTAGIMTDPAIAGIYVRSFGMARAIVEATVFVTGGGVLRGCVAHSCGPALRRLRMELAAVLFAATLLCERKGAAQA